MSKYYLYSGITALLYSIYALSHYYTLNSVLLISAPKAKALLKTKNVQVLDVRTKLEYKMGHFPNSFHIPVNDINKDSTSVLSKNKYTIVYCNTGQRARYASEKLKNLGFTNIFYISTTYKSLL